MKRTSTNNIIHDDYVAIELTQGKYAFVDRDDYEELPELKEIWHAEKHINVNNSLWYACRQRSDRKHLRMEIVICPHPAGFSVDHIDFNGLNNRKYNLRLATQQQQVWHTRGWCSSQYKGVRYDEERKYYVANCRRPDSSTLHIGCFQTEIEAAYAYNIMAQQEQGEWAYLNDLGSYKSDWKYVPPEPPSSQYNGICKRGDYWRARFTIDGSRKNLGSYTSEEKAKTAIDLFQTSKKEYEAHRQAELEFIETIRATKYGNAAKQYVYKGMSKNAKQWSEYAGIGYTTFKQRLELGWSIDKAIEEPIDEARRSNFARSHPCLSQNCTQYSQDKRSAF